MYSIGEVAKELNLPISTIRYYDKQELLVTLKRNASGQRVFDEQDMDVLRHIACFKASGMSIATIRNYLQLYEKGTSTLDEREVLLTKQRDILLDKLAELKQAQTILENKLSGIAEEKRKLSK